MAISIALALAMVMAMALSMDIAMAIARGIAKRRIGTVRISLFAASVAFQERYMACLTDLESWLWDELCALVNTRNAVIPQRLIAATY